MQQRVSIDLMGITKKYGNNFLFSQITKSIEPGVCLAVTGSNGSGKSTLLKVMAGLIRPTAGHVKVRAGGRELSASEQAGCFGLVSPEIVFYNNMTGFENVDFILQSAGIRLLPARLVDCLATVGLPGRCHHFVGAYSTGMRQRLKFAVLAALERPVWLLDEPSSNLDGAGKMLVKSLVMDALAKNTVVVIATNEAEGAAYAGQKIALG